jgi:ribonuclease D
LHRDFGIEISSLFDTQIAAAFLGIKETSLASLLKNRFGVTIEKKYQKKDWSQRPLKKEMLDYAVRDSFYLLPLARVLEEELRSKDLLFCVEEECESLCKVRAKKDDSQHLFLKYKGAGKLDPRSLTILEEVLQFRMTRAKEMDRPPFKVLGNIQVDKIVKEKPKSVAELLQKQCLTPKQIKNFGPAISRQVEEALALPEESLLRYPRRAGFRLGPKMAKRVRALKRWREQRAMEMGIDPALICPNAQIKSLATLQPKTQNDLMEVKKMRDWQRRLFGQEICAILK